MPNSYNCFCGWKLSQWREGNLNVANYFLLTGNYLSTTQAMNVGLVDTKVDNIHEMLEQFAQPIARHPRALLIRMKNFIHLKKSKIAA
ncbi:enoyl-CoA hydratase/isomerase family protein [Chroogloeocystis siderophila]|uniref:enoyl-CoA hydratase/isomerase family protein n=1 Tax=Chroogloeocystis siderophila TaxID=329163 RepID=UPI000936341B